MSMDWNGDGKKDYLDKAIDYAIYKEIYEDGDNGKKPDGGDGCGVIIGIALIIFIILLIF